MHGAWRSGSRLVAFAGIRLYSPAMNLLSTLRFALCVLAITGMVGSSFARSAMAMAPDIQAIQSDASAEHADMEMANGMPCCPKDMPQPGGMKDCPFMTLCLAKIVFAAPASSFMEPVLMPGMAWHLDGADMRDNSKPPPSRPPIA